MKVLYLMHVDWNWIKQRPHFLAIELAKHMKILVIYSYSWRRGTLTNNPPGTLSVKPLYNIPFSGRFRVIRYINEKWIKFHFNKYLKSFKPDIIWVTYPMFADLLPPNGNIPIIYDCMDDVQAFDGLNTELKEFLLKREIRLLELASVIFASSEHLRSVIKLRYLQDKDITLIRNAFGGEVLDIGNSKISAKKKDNILKIGYIGTISSWFDFESLIFCINKVPDIRFCLVGPIDIGFIIPELPKEIELIGPVNHNDLIDVVKDFDCMIMPFRVNQLVESVDPVKLYEYINFNKPILSVFYKEIERFEPYVYFYNSKEELVSIVEEMKTGISRKYSDQDRINFLANNSWESRREQILEILKNKNLVDL